MMKREDTSPWELTCTYANGTTGYTGLSTETTFQCIDGTPFIPAPRMDAQKNSANKVKKISFIPFFLFVLALFSAVSA
ncbi:hypothetical protein CLIB1444_07S05204 [[Candida] jaroonii]|uniref:Uncharacterized protein n=1 Tax=[Candida] jaroonii TaxID=467808 RepID=A0ACA9YAN5_9ASCO|nr:hypothetical protein CLIB1444_07S05204 [[Candida] jaroonii]